MGNRRPKRIRSYSSKRSRYRKSPSGQINRDVYSKYNRTGRPIVFSNRQTKQMMSTSGQTTVRKRMNNTNKGLRNLNRNI
jgi:CTP:molybdopterin cytidylyltransferase MocA